MEWDDCGGCGGVGVNTINCTSCNGSGKRTELPSCAQTILINRDQYELYKEAAEKWATDAAFKTDVRFVSDTGSVEIGVMCSQCGAKLACKHAADCKAARILGLKRKGAG